MKQSGHVLGGALLITGTAIGAGMLALPVLTSLGGFLPSVVIYFICWAFMACTGLLMLEVCLWMKGETNLVSMAQYTLGRPGRYAAWGLYLFMFYDLTIAYVSGSGNLLVALVDDIVIIPNWLATLIFLGVFVPFVYCGAKAVDKLNAALIAGLGISFLIFVLLGRSHVDVDNLQRVDWKASLFALPITFAAFGYQGIVPTITSYLNYNYKKVRKAILIGSAIPLFTYIGWEWLILGIVPTEGPGGLIETLANNQSAVHPLKMHLNNRTVFIIGEFFAFFALVTSFLGVTLALLDFLADGLQVKKDARGRAFLCTIIFLPPLVLSFTNPHIFIDAVRYAGGFGVAMLLGVLPILMVWSGRYRMRLETTQRLFGGRPLLVILLSFVSFEIIFECIQLWRKCF